MSLVKTSFSQSIGIPLCLKQVMVSHIHASHLRVWQTQLSNIASSCIDIDKTVYKTNMTLVLGERCVTPGLVKSCICLSQSKYWNLKSRLMSQSKLKENTEDNYYIAFDTLNYHCCRELILM